MLRDASIAVWRMLVLWTFAFWQGGFLFYTSAVVPTAQHVIGHLQQGFITRHVTVYLNGAGVAALGVLAVDMIVAADPRRGRRIALWSLWLAMAVCQGALYVLHPRMDEMLMPATLGVEDGFYLLHRVYLWTHTVQFAAAVFWSALQIAAWRTRDRNGSAAQPGSSQ